MRDTFLFAYAVSGVGPDWARSAWFGAYIFFSNLAEAYFIWILIIIAAGYWCGDLCVLDAAGPGHPAAGGGAVARLCCPAPVFHPHPP